MKLAHAGLPKDWDVPEGGAKLLLLMTLHLQGQAHSGPSGATGGMELDPPHPWKGCNLCYHDLQLSFAKGLEGASSYVKCLPVFPLNPPNVERWIFHTHFADEETQGLRGALGLLADKCGSGIPLGSS